MDTSDVGALLLLSVFVGAAVCALVGGIMLDRVNRGATGALLGFFLGPAGIVIAWVLRDNALRDEERERAGAQRRAGAATDGHLPARRTAPATELDALERLAKLREGGHLTDEEFAAKKREILGGMSTASARAPAAQPPAPRRFR